MRARASSMTGEMRFVVALLALLPTSVHAQSTPPYLFEWELPRTSAEVSSPNAVAVAGNGKLYLTDVTNNRVLVYTLNGALVHSWDVPSLPTGITIAQTGTVYVVAGGALHAYSDTGTLLLTIGAGLMGAPRETALTPEGHLLVTDPGRGVLHKFSADGAYLGPLAAGVVGQPIDVAVDQDGTLFVTDESPALNCVWKLTAGGSLLEKWGGPGVEPGQFNGPSGICIDVARNVFVGDHNNGRIQRLATTGAFLGAWSYAAPGASTLGSTD